MKKAGKRYDDDYLPQMEGLVNMCKERNSMNTTEFRRHQELENALLENECLDAIKAERKRVRGQAHVRLLVSGQIMRMMMRDINPEDWDYSQRGQAWAGLPVVTDPRLESLTARGFEFVVVCASPQRSWKI